MTEPAALAFRTLETNGRREWLTGRPRGIAPALLILPPLFAEMNRTRAMIADLMEALSIRGYSPWLLDLPGTGESETPLEMVGWDDWRIAAADAADALQPAAVIGLRGGVMLEPERALPRWRLAPVTGAALLRDLMRARLASEAAPRTTAAAIEAALAGETVELAGYRLAPALSSGLRDAIPPGAARVRAVALADGLSIDAVVAGPAIWRRAEPGRAPDLAEALAKDIAAWLASC